MKKIEHRKRPTKIEQKTAIDSYSLLTSIIPQLNDDQVEIEIEETKDRIKIPLKALKLLRDILQTMSEGRTISIFPVATEVTTQKAAELLGCSRPHIVKLLEDGEIPYTKVGRHRRILFEDIVNYKVQKKNQQKQHIIDIINADEELGLYGS